MTKKIISQNDGEDVFLEVKFKNGDSTVVRIPSDGTVVEIENKDLMDIKKVKRLKTITPSLSSEH